MKKKTLCVRSLVFLRLGKRADMFDPQSVACFGRLKTSGGVEGGASPHLQVQCSALHVWKQVCST